jgi:hypothetical protein
MSDRQEPSITVDRGNPVTVTVTFIADRAPAEVNFQYTRPGSERPYVDDGFGQKHSRIEQLDELVFRYSISTKGFPSGEGHWHFSAEWDEPLPEGHDNASIRGTYVVRDAPAQLP